LKNSATTPPYQIRASAFTVRKTALDQYRIIGVVAEFINLFYLKLLRERNIHMTKQALVPRLKPIEPHVFERSGFLLRAIAIGKAAAFGHVPLIGRLHHVAVKLPSVIHGFRDRLGERRNDRHRNVLFLMSFSRKA
jgi:hypothetical protein